MASIDRTASVRSRVWRVSWARAFGALLAAAAAASCAPQPAAWDVGGSGTGVALGAPPAGSPGRRLLANATSMPGENYLATVPVGGLGGRPSAGRVLSSAGPLPSPFEFAISRDFAPVPGRGDFGYVFATPEPGVTCALAVGPAGPGAGLVLRNCVPGDLAAALAPLDTLGGF